MGSVLAYLLPLMIGNVAVPTWVLLVLFLLRKGSGPFEAMALVGGISAVRLLQGLVFGLVFRASDLLQANDRLGTIISAVLMLGTGILLWVTAFVQIWRKHDNDSAVNKLLTTIAGLTPIRALGLGAVLVLTSSRAWLFTLTALDIVYEANLGLAQSVGAFLLYVAGSEVLLVAPILVPRRYSGWLDATTDWLETHSRPIVVVVPLVVGAFFLWSGVAELLG